MKEIGEWKKLEIRRKDKKAQVSFSKGKAKYVRFNPTSMKDYGLKEKKSVDIFIMEEDKYFHIAFKFQDDDTGTLKLSKNIKTGTGYVSASSLFNEIGLDNKKIKQNGFSLTYADTPIGNALILKLDKDLLNY